MPIHCPSQYGGGAVFLIVIIETVYHHSFMICLAQWCHK